MAEKEPQVHPCKQQRTLVLAGTLLMVALGWLFSTVHASEVERAVLKSRLEQMAEDVSAIRATIETLTKERRGN